MPFGEKVHGGWGFKLRLGRSYYTSEPVVSSIKNALPSTMLLAVVAILFATIVGVSIGLLIAVQGKSWWGDAILSVCSLGMSAPSFVVAIIVAWLFGYVLHSYTGLPIQGVWWK